MDSLCPECGHEVREVDGVRVPHDVEGLEPIGEGYFSGKNPEGIGHKRCFPKFAPHRVAPAPVDEIAELRPDRKIEALVASARESLGAVEILASLALLLRGEVDRAEETNRRTLDGMADELKIDRGCSASDLLAEVRRLTDANTRLTDLVRHQRGALLTEGLITDAEYADLAGLTGSPARLEGYDALRVRAAAYARTSDDAARTREDVILSLVKERDKARTALATARLDGARAMLREVEARAEGVAERHEGLAKAARTKDDRNRATAKQAAAEAVFGAIREIRAIDPAAVVGSGS